MKLYTNMLSRYGTERVFNKISDDLIEFIAYETLYYTCTGNDLEDLDSIDPDGGPFIQKGGVITIDMEKYAVIKFENIDFDEKTEILKVMIKVEKEDTVL